MFVRIVAFVVSMLLPFLVSSGSAQADSSSLNVRTSSQSLGLGTDNNTSPDTCTLQQDLARKTLKTLSRKSLVQEEEVSVNLVKQSSADTSLHESFVADGFKATYGYSAQITEDIHRSMIVGKDGDSLVAAVREYDMSNPDQSLSLTLYRFQDNRGTPQIVDMVRLVDESNGTVQPQGPNLPQCKSFDFECVKDNCAWSIIPCGIGGGAVYVACVLFVCGVVAQLCCTSWTSPS